MARPRERGPGVKPLHARITEKIVVGEHGCWLWQGSVFASGYGQIRVGGRQGKLRRVHVVAYEEWIGPVPEGLELDHYRFPAACAGPLCTNPEHVRPETHRTNSLRSSSPWAINARKTHCGRGHEFTPSNTYIKRSGTRECRTCKRSGYR